MTGGWNTWRAPSLEFLGGIGVAALFAVLPITPSTYWAISLTLIPIVADLTWRIAGMATQSKMRRGAYAIVSVAVLAAALVWGFSARFALAKPIASSSTNVNQSKIFVTGTNNIGQQNGTITNNFGVSPSTPSRPVDRRTHQQLKHTHSSQNRASVVVNGPGAVGNMYGGTVNNNFGPSPPLPEAQVLTEKHLPDGRLELIVAIHIKSDYPVGTVKIDGNDHVQALGLVSMGQNQIFNGIVVSGAHMEISNKRDFVLRVLADGIGQPHLGFSFD